MQFSFTRLDRFFIAGFFILVALQQRLEATGGTSLTNDKIRFESCDSSHIKLERGQVSVIIVDNAALDLPELPGHLAGYNGIASLRHKQRYDNAFVPTIAGLNFEHIHDGTTIGLTEKFEPRKFPMQLRRINAHTVELYQPPTGNWKLESCGRYSLLEDGTIEYTFECIPHAISYSRGFIGLFWASYIHKPKDKAIHFIGQPSTATPTPGWIKATSPKHGVESTHPPAGYPQRIAIDPDFPLTLVGNRSKHEHSDAWYYGVTNGMALAYMFRPKDNIWFAQSPTGGGNGNPAWDFQWFIHNPKVGKSYGFTMRAAYLPFASRSAVIKATAPHRDALRRQ